MLTKPGAVKHCWHLFRCRNIIRTKVLVEEGKWGEVTAETEELCHHHEPVPGTNCQRHHQQLGQDERCEGDCDHVHELWLEQHQRAVHEDATWWRQRKQIEHMTPEHFNYSCEGLEKVKPGLMSRGFVWVFSWRTIYSWILHAFFLSPFFISSAWKIGQAVYWDTELRIYVSSDKDWFNNITHEGKRCTMCSSVSHPGKRL